MKKSVLLLAFIGLVQINVFAQDTIYQRPQDPYRERQIPLRERLFFGGDLGLQFGSFTYINIAPIIGYKVSERFGIGLGPEYAYMSDKRYPGYEYTTNSYGGRLFGQYRVIESAIAYAEYEMINAEVVDDVTYMQERVTIPSFLVGGGYVSPIGGNSSFNLMILFNLIEDRFSYYENPIFRAGVNVGF